MEKILIHALGATMGGAKRHLTNFLPELAIQDTSREYLVMVRESFSFETVYENIKFEQIPDQECASWMRRTFGDVIKLPLRIKRDKFSCVVSLTNFGPVWSPVPHIFFQRNALYYCPYYLDKVGGRKKIEMWMRRRLAIASMMRADMIVTPSHSMAEMIQVSCPKTRRRRFHSLYHGFSEENLNEPLDEIYVNMLDVTTGAKLLLPTHAAAHKGVDVLLQILSLLKQEGLKFCLFATFSKKDWSKKGIVSFMHSIKKLGLTDNIVLMGRVPQGQMGALYEQCDLMIYPSHCESFGFSMLEAMGFGLPIVAADLSINREICGESALFYPSLDAESGALAINKALSPITKERLYDGGRKRFHSFDWSWQRYVREFLNILDDVI